MSEAAAPAPVPRGPDADDDAAAASEVPDEPDVVEVKEDSAAVAESSAADEPAKEVPDAPDVVTAGGDAEAAPPPAGVEMPAEAEQNIEEDATAENGGEGGAAVKEKGEESGDGENSEGEGEEKKTPQPGDVVERAQRPDDHKEKEEEFAYTDIHPDVENAARMIQRNYRSRLCIKRLLEIVRNQYEMVFDPETGDYFYFNKKTGESQWTKPATVKNKQTYRDDAVAVEAARKIQNMLRVKLAMRRLREMIKGIYKKEYDPSTGDFYYLNTVNGQTMWDKPAPHLLADDEDLELDEDSALLIARDDEIARLRQQLAERDADIQRVRKARLEELEEEDRSKKLVDALRGQKRSKHMDEWTAEHVCAWIMSMEHMEQYAPGFVKNRVDGLLMLHMEEQDMTEIGVVNKLHQRRIFVSRKKFDERYAAKEAGEEISDGEDEASLGSETPSEILGDGSDEEEESEEESAGDSDDELIPTEEELLEMQQDEDNMHILVKYKGDGENYPKVGDIVRCHYSMFVPDGKSPPGKIMVESSRKIRHRAMEFVLGVGQVITGWDRALMKMSKLERSIVTLQPLYAYGDEGLPPLIPPKCVLELDVELISFRKRPYWFKKLVQPPGYSDKPFIVTQEEKNDIAANDEIERPEEDEEEEGAAEA